MVPWTLVSPANRGIGFALARHLLLHTGAPVLATTRRDGDGVRRELLRGLDADAYGERRQVDEKRLTVVELDVTGMSLQNVFLFFVYELQGVGSLLDRSVTGSMRGLPM